MTKEKAYSWLTQPGIVATLYHYDKHTNEALKVAIEALQEPERKTGHWRWETIPTIDGLHSYTQVRCSECGERFITDVHFCPNCGCKMEVNYETD